MSTSRTNSIFGFGVFAVIPNRRRHVLALESSDETTRGWLLPGGAVDPGESIYDALARECREEIGVDVKAEALTGVYYHAFNNSQVVIFRCTPIDPTEIRLSDEHLSFSYVPVTAFAEVQRIRVEDAFNNVLLPFGRAFPPPKRLPG